MKPRLLVLLLLIPMAVGAFAQDSSKVLAMENAWNKAELTNDANAVQLLLANDFVMTTADGELYNKAQMVASIRDQSYQPSALQSSDMVVHAFGTTAVVTGAYYEKGTDKGKQWERRGRFTDTWVFLDNRWQCVASHFSVKAK
jgi:ketosteroid isomerase-like protein